MKRKLSAQNSVNTHMRIFACVLHHVLPVPVHCCEHSSLFGHLLIDVLRREDRFEVQPLRLNFQPLVYCLLDTNQPLLPFLSMKQCGVGTRNSSEHDALNYAAVKDKAIQTAIWFDLFFAAFAQAAPVARVAVHKTECPCLKLHSTTHESVPQN